MGKLCLDVFALCQCRMPLLYRRCVLSVPTNDNHDVSSNLCKCNRDCKLASQLSRITCDRDTSRLISHCEHEGWYNVELHD